MTKNGYMTGAPGKSVVDNDDLGSDADLLDGLLKRGDRVVVAPELVGGFAWPIWWWGARWSTSN